VNGKPANDIGLCGKEHDVRERLRAGRHKGHSFTLAGGAALASGSEGRHQVRAITLTARRGASEGHGGRTTSGP
jgi:hypothetical protein